MDENEMKCFMILLESQVKRVLTLEQILEHHLEWHRYNGDDQKIAHKPIKEE